MGCVNGLPVYLESSSKRVFAGAVDWPGLDRGGKDEADALEALLAAAPRYKAALGTTARGLRLPERVDEFEVVERHKGNASTEFGIPALGASADSDPVDGAALKQLTAILDGAWSALDDAAAAARGLELRKGPRGGGRELAKILEHVREAEKSYAYQIGGKVPAAEDDLEQIRAVALEALRARAANEPFEMGRRKAPLWTPRYYVRRSAWHIFDHAWEIEDRAKPPG